MIDEIDKRYQRIGLKIVAIPYMSSDVYQIILRDPVGPNGDLKGRKLRATPQYRPILQLSRRGRSCDAERRDLHGPGKGGGRRSRLDLDRHPHGQVLRGEQIPAPSNLRRGASPGPDESQSMEGAFRRGSHGRGGRGPHGRKGVGGRSPPQDAGGGGNPGQGPRHEGHPDGRSLRQQARVGRCRRRLDAGRYRDARGVAELRKIAQEKGVSK